MKPIVTITEILGRSEQGVTRPFICRGGFFQIFYVKGSDDDPEGALWKDQPRREMLWAYDFNLAFDEDFNRERFFGSHVFGEALRQWPVGFRERMEPRLRAALDEVRAIFAELPLGWLHLDGDENLPVQLDVERVISTLELPFTDPATFWNLP